MSDKLYDLLSKVQRWLPALGAFYLGLSKVWFLPLGDEINQTIALVATLLAATLEIATVQYHKGLEETMVDWDEIVQEMDYNKEDEGDQG